MIFRRRAVLALLTALFALALPVAPSAAVTYTVDSLEDQPDKEIGLGDCETAVGTCTLRAAIQELNVSTAASDKIDFEPAFQGDPGDTIALSSPLPSIVHPILIDGDGLFDNRCMNDTFSINGPCIEITAPNASTAALVVDNADGVIIEGLSVTGSRTAISVIDSSSSFVAHGNWLGVKLDGTAGANTTGIFLDPNSNGATIGGTAASDRNVFGNNSAEGLDIEGADNADVRSNYFGIRPDGATQAANGKNIEITDTVAFEATGNEVGTTVASGNAPCDGGCNVISGAASSGIDLQGNGVGQNEEPATGPTTIHGNFIGLNAAGTATVANNAGVNVGGAPGVLIGGPENQDANYIAGGAEGIFASDAEGLEAVGNIIGSGAPGAEITAPAKGVWLLTASNANPVAVSGNVFDMDGGVAVQVHFGGTEVTDNFIEGAELGVWTKVGPNAAGANLIEDNVIGESTANGIRIEDDANLVFGNSIYDSGSAGVRIQSPAPLLNAIENRIGGDTPDSENNIRESGGDAIEIDNSAGEGTSYNEVARNRGEQNAGSFIDLVGPLTNGGIQPPAFATAQQSSASGSGAEPGATIRVFRKETAAAGEVESFLAETIADGSGNWKATYPTVPGDTIIAATQTSEEGGTSELATAKVLPDPIIVIDGGCEFLGNCPSDGGDKGPIVACVSVKAPCPGGGDTVPPTAKILKGPEAESSKTTATFKFSSNEAGSTFQCKFDGKPFKRCKPPKKYKNLKPGKHVFKVKATDKAGNTGKVAKRKFTVLE